MARFTYAFILHCKGKEECINEFRLRVADELASDFTESDLNRSPAEMYFYREEAGGKFYEPFVPLMQHFTAENGKPLAFFFELIKGESSSDNSNWCGYAVFDENGGGEEKSCPMGYGKEIKSRLAEWLGDESVESEDDAVDEEWQYQVQCRLDDIYHAGLSLEDIDEEYRTVEVCLAALSGIEDPDEREEQTEYVPDDIKEKVQSVLESGKGFTEKELYEKVKRYTAKDMRD
ncbi:MAG: hypothetical protein LBP76_00440 [Treponema sp.]|nr:hypothetical protein [Treponema sp.]